jgi:hypothetical protein
VAPGERAAGETLAEPERTTYVVDFLSSSEGIQLNKAFVRIKDPKLRRRVIDLVRALVGEDETEA